MKEAFKILLSLKWSAEKTLIIDLISHLIYYYLLVFFYLSISE